MAALRHRFRQASVDKVCSCRPVQSPSVQPISISLCRARRTLEALQPMYRNRHASDQMKERARGFTAKIRDKLPTLQSMRCILTKKQLPFVVASWMALARITSLSVLVGFGRRVGSFRTFLPNSLKLFQNVSTRQDVANATNKAKCQIAKCEIAKKALKKVCKAKSKFLCCAQICVFLDSKASIFLDSDFCALVLSSMFTKGN